MRTVFFPDAFMSSKKTLTTCERRATLGLVIPYTFTNIPKIRYFYHGAKENLDLKSTSSRGAIVYMKDKGKELVLNTTRGSIDWCCKRHTVKPPK